MRHVTDAIAWLVIGIMVLWTVGAKERFDCWVLHVAPACAVVSADYPVASLQGDEP